jgi:hypothetical protein
MLLYCVHEQLQVVVAHHHAKHGKFAGSGFKNINVEGQKFRVLLGTSPEEVYTYIYVLYVYYSI